MSDEKDKAAADAQAAKDADAKAQQDAADQAKADAQAQQDAADAQAASDKASKKAQAASDKATVAKATGSTDALTNKQQAALAGTGALGVAAGFAAGTTASTGKVVEVPKTPEEIAEQGTKMGLAGDFATGGNPPETEQGQPVSADAPKFTRVWGMDADHTTRFRNDPDCLKPDLSVSQ